jgi:radical SAM superfamily enzyme YgiQ (UPF0313 family)
MINTLIYSLPPLDRLRPPLSGAILASVCKNLGHTCHAVDLQMELDNFLKINNVNGEYFDDVFYEHSNSFDNDQLALLKIFILQELEKLKGTSYNFVLVSFFSYLALPFGQIFLKELRQATSAKIIVGGAGITEKYFTNEPCHAVNKLKKQNIIDEFITGECEHALPLYFKTGGGPGIGNNNFVQIDQLDLLPWPDYSYYNLDAYQANQQKELCIIGSRGCVRRCTFCDVAKTSPKYRYRSGQNIANEIIHHYNQFGITRYYFTDSLVNGSFKAFDEMAQCLAEYQFPDPISWSGQYIIRSKNTTPKDHFKKLKESGCSTLFIGIESGSDRVRFELGKKFTNDDIEYYLENFARYNIQVLFLFFTGYISETAEDHAETLTMFKRWQKYVATGTIQGIETLNLLGILPGSPLEEIAKHNGFLFLTDDNNKINLRHWINPALPDFDFKERVKRHLTMMEEAMRYKWPLWNGQLSMRLYEQAIIKFINSPKKYIPLTQALTIPTPTITKQ